MSTSERMAIDERLKYLIEVLGGDLKQHPRQVGRRRAYGPEVDDALRLTQESLDYICAERLTPNLVWIGQHPTTRGETAVNEALPAR